MTQPPSRTSPRSAAWNRSDPGRPYTVGTASVAPQRGQGGSVGETRVRVRVQMRKLGEYGWRTPYTGFSEDEAMRCAEPPAGGAV